MQLCNIDKSQRELLYRAIAAIINDAIQNKQPIDTKKIGNQIYDIVYKKSQDNAKALSYVLLVPKAIDQILSFNDNFKDYAVDNKFEFDELAKLVSSLNKSSEETILNDISTFLGKMSNKNSFEDAQKDLQNLQSEQAKNKNSKILVPSSYLAKPESLYTTTGQQGLREDINIPDPSMQFYYDIIKKLNTNYINEEGGVVYPNVKSGLFLSIISGVNIADNEMYTRDAGNRNEYNKNFFLALTDNLGKIMYFDTNYNVVERSAGKPIYFPLRTNLDSIVDKLNIGQSQLESLREAAKFINQDKVNNRVVNKITFKSDGYLSTSNSLPKVDIASIKNNNILTFVTVPGSNQLYVSSKGEYHFTVDVSFKDFTTVRANLIADLILNPVYKDGKLLSNNDKYNILSNWLFQREMKFGQKNKKFYVTLNGQSLNLEDKEDSKEKIVNFLTRKIKTDKTEYQNKFTWQSRLLENNETISLFSLSVEDGKYIYTDNPVSYQEYLKQITFAKIQTVDGEIFPMNGYIGYELGNRISKPKPVETKVEIKKQTPVTLDTNEYNRAVKEADSKKPIEQNFFDGYRPNSDKTKIHTIRPEITSIYGKGVKTLKLVQEGIRTRSTRLANWMKENNPKVGDYFWQINKKNPSEKVLTRITAVYDKTDPRFKNNWFKEGWVDSDFKYVEDYAGAIEFEVIKSVVAIGVQPQVTTEEKFDLIPTRPISEIEKEIESFESEIRYAAGQLEQLQTKMELVEDEETIESFILSQFTPVNPESARKETGTNIGTKQDINPALLNKRGPSVERLAEEIGSLARGVPYHFRAEDDYIRDQIIEILVKGKAKYKEELQGGNLQDIKYYEERINDISKKLDELNVELENAKLAPPVSTPQETVQIESIEESIVNESETKEEDIDLGEIDPNDLKNLLEKRILQKESEVKATNEKIKKALPWYNSIKTKSGKKLSSFLPIKEMFDAVNTSNPNAVAHWSMSGITLFNGSDYSDLYHEAWHAFTQQFLTTEERNNLYNAVRGKSGTFEDYNGNIVEFSLASKKQIEEFLAEEFREFMLRDGKGMYEKKSIFSKIFNKIRELLLWLFDRTTYYDVYNNSKATRNISRLFNELRIGELAEPVNEVDPDFAIKGLDRVIKVKDSSDTFTIEESKTISDTIDSLFSEYSDKVNNATKVKSASIQLQISPTFQLNAYKYAKNRLIQRKNELVQKVKTKLSEKKIDDLNTEELNLFRKDIKNINLLKKAIKAFIIPENLNNVKSAKEIDGIISSHQQLSEYLKDIVQLEEEYNILNNNVIADRAGNANSFEQLTDPKLLYTFGGVFERDEKGEIIKNSLGFNKTMAPKRVFNKLSNILETNDNEKRPNNITALYKKMESLQKTDPFIKDILNKLGSPYTTNTNVNSLWSALEVLILPVAHVMRAEIVKGDNNSISAVFVTNASLETESAIRSFANYTAVLDSSDPNNFLFENADGVNIIDLRSIFVPTEGRPKNYGNSKAAQENPLEFLRAIGIYLPNDPNVIKELMTEEAQEYINRLYNAALEIKNYNYSKGTKESDKIEVFSIKEILKDYSKDPKYKNVKKLPKGQSVAKKFFTKLYLKYSDQSNNLSITTVDDKTVFQRSLPNTLMMKAQIINSADSFNNLVSIPETEDLAKEINGKTKNPWSKASQLLNKVLFDEKGNKREGARIDIASLDGLKIRLDEVDLAAIKSSDSDPYSKQLLDIIFTLEYGVSEATRHAGKSSTFLFEITRSDGSKHYIDLEKFTRNISKGENIFNSGIVDAVNIFVNYLASEYERIQLATNDPENKNIRTGNGKSMAEVGSEFLLFKDIIPKSILDNIKSIEGVETYEDFLQHLDNNVSLRDSIKKNIYNYLNNVVKQELNDFNKLNVKKEFNDILHKKMKSASQRALKGGKITKETELNYNQLRNSAITAYTINSLIHNIETGLLFYGDPAIFNNNKQDYQKRNSGAGSTGIVTRTDDAYLQFINSKGGLGKVKNEQRNFDGTLNTVVLNDPKTTAKLYNEYIKAAKNKESERLKKLKKSQKEIDIALKKIEEKFSEAYENMKEADAQGYISFSAYRALSWGMNKWTLAQELGYQKIMNGEKIDNADILYPVRKYQYWGSLQTKGLPATAFHKFSLLPLIPTLTENAPHLNALRMKMENEGIDYLTFETGSKAGTIAIDNKLDNLYKGDSSDRILDLPVEFTKNVVFAKFLKEQLSIAPQFKETVTFSTQLRKLVIEGLWEEGKPVGKNEEEKNNVKQKTAAYINAVNNLTELLFIELKDKAGINPETNKVENKVKLIDYLTNALENKDTPYHIIEQIASLKTRLQTGISFDYLIQASDIEKLITGLVYKKVINQKVYGEGLIQVSTAGWAVKKDDNLKFYRTENGVVKPMQVKIAMQGEFLNLLQHPDVLDIVSAEENITELQALNRLLKDEAWVNKNREMITLMGPRIPVQGLNSMEVMEIAEFLPRNYGNVIVVPSEIVGKAGSDFDVDKLSIVFPGIKVYNGVPQVVNFNKNLFKQTTRSQLIKEKVRLEKLVDVTYETRRGLYEMIKDDAIFTDEQRVALERLYAEHKEQMAEVNIRIKELEAQWEETGGAEVLLKGTIPDDYSLQNTLLNTYAERARIRKQFQNNRYLYKSTFIDEDFKNDLEAIENKIDDVTKQIDSISIAAAEYDVLKSTIDILLLPQNFVSLITPNTTIDAKGLSKEMRKRVDFGYSTEDNFLKENKGFSPTRIYEPKYNREKLDYNKVGKDSLGIGAVDNTFNVLLNYVGAYLNNDVAITKDYSRRIVIRGLKHNKYKDTENISLSKIYDANNEFKISDIISQFINGWVDVEKDEWIFFIQGNKELSSTLLFMIQAGIPLNDAVVFLNQPIIRDYYNRVRLALSPASEILEEGKKDKYVRNKVFDDLMYNNDIYRNIYDGEKEKTKKSFSKAGRFYAISTIAEKYKFNKESLESKLSNPIGTYSQDDYAILGHFFELRENANSLTNIKMALNFDTKRETSIDEVKEKLNKRGQIYGSILPKEIINKLLNESPISSFNIQKDIVAMMEALFPVRMSDVVEDAINDTDETVWKNIGENLNFDDRTKIVDAKNAFRNALIPYLFQESYYSLNEEEYRGYKIKYTSDYADRVVVISPTEPDVILINQTAVDNLITSTNNNSKKLYMPEFMLTAYGVASLPVNTFKNINENIGLRKYLIEREIQRTLDENSFEKISKSLLYKTYKNKLKIEDVNNPYLSVNNQLTSLTSQLNISKEEAYNLLAYELVLRDKSLNNLNFPGWLFYDTKNEQTSYGSQLNYIKRKYNFLEREFSVLDALEVRRNKNTNEVNIKLKDTRITGSEKNIFQSQINMLSDPQKLLEIKSSLSEADINEITSFFKRFHVFAYLQSAANSTSSTYNLLPIANPMVIENLIAQPIQDFASFEYDQFSENNEEVTNYIIERDNKIETVETAIKNYNNILSAQFKTNHVTLIKQRFEWNADTLSLQEQQAAEEDNLKLLKAQNPLGLVEVPTKAEKNIIKNKGKKTVFSLITNSLGQAYLYESEAKGLDAVVIENLDTLKDDYLFIGNTGTETFTDGTISKVDDGKLLQSQAFLGVPSRKIKGDLTDETLEENKKLIDDAIQNILNRRSNKLLVFNKNGYGQNLIGRNPNNASELKGKVTAPKTFQYLSQKLAQHFGFVNPNSTLQSTVDESKVKTISTDYGVVQAETNPTKEFDQKLADAIYQDVKDNSYVENGSNTAQRMWANGLMWKGNNTKKPTGQVLKVQPAQVDYNANGKLTPVKTPYFYDSEYNDGTPVAPITNLDFLKKHIENTLGIDMSDYDVSLNNIYEEGHDLFRHTDIDESNTAKNYPVIVYVFGNNHKVRFDDNGGKRAMGKMVNPKTLTLKNGDIYAFGVNGKGRFETVHDVVASPKTNDNFPELIGSDGKPTKKYTVTFTFRRAADLEPGMPKTPANFNTTNTNTTVTVNKPSEYTNHSGGAKGADTAWDVEAKKLGYLTNDVHWREPGKTEIDSLELKKLGRTATPMSPELYARGKQIADIIDESFGEDPNRAGSHYRYRNYAQVANSDAIFAISQGFGVRPKDPKKRYAPLDRGTLYAIYGAIYDGKPVYVYDQMASVWRTFNRETKKWQETGIPKLTQNFAGVGSRNLEENGRQAIIDVLKNTFGQNAPSSITPSKISVPLTSLEIYNAIINDIKSCGI